jgi:radical SAM superfamily enzyme YgiQ (UPF0313 family)
MMDKRIKINQARKAIMTLGEEGIECRIYLIIGLPGEPEDIVDQTWKFIKETNPVSVYLSIFTVRPGTEVFTHPSRFGIKKVSMDWSKTMHMYSRYDSETPELTFEYDSVTPWGKGFSPKRIVENYLELQDRIKEAGLGPVK